MGNGVVGVGGWQDIFVLELGFSTFCDASPLSPRKKKKIKYNAEMVFKHQYLPLGIQMYFSQGYVSSADLKALITAQLSLKTLSIQQTVCI